MEEEKDTTKPEEQEGGDLKIAGDLEINVHEKIETEDKVM